MPYYLPYLNGMTSNRNQICLEISLQICQHIILQILYFDNYYIMGNKSVSKTNYYGFVMDIPFRNDDTGGKIYDTC